MVCQPTHEKFYKLSYTSISRGLKDKLKLQKKVENIVQGEHAFHKGISEALTHRTFSVAHGKYADALGKVIEGLQEKAPKASERISTRKGKAKAKADPTVGRVTPAMSAAQRKQYPELYMLCRHGYNWVSSEGREAKKAGSLYPYIYAYTMHASWFCYVETVGIMLHSCPDYIEFRKSFFDDFLSKFAQPTINQWLPRREVPKTTPGSSTRTADNNGEGSKKLATRYLNWDAELIDRIKQEAAKLPALASFQKILRTKDPKLHNQWKERQAIVMKSIERVAKDILKYPLAYGITKEPNVSLKSKQQSTLRLTPGVEHHLRGLLRVRQSCDYGRSWPLDLMEY